MWRKSRITTALAWSSALAFSLVGAAHAQRSGYTQRVSLPEGTVLRAELKDSLSSLNNQPGDTFTATIQSDRDGSGLPTGTEVIGQVRTVRRASTRQPGIIDVDFRSLRTPDGRSYPITGSLTSLDSKNVRRTADGRLESRGSSSSKDRTKWIGYGAGAGAIIGALSGGDLLTSGLLGAAAGYLYGELTKDKQRNGQYSDVSLKSGTEFGVALDRPVTMTVAADRYGATDDRYNRSDSRYDSRYDTRTSGAYDRYRGRSTSSYDPYRDRAVDIRVLVNNREVRFGDGRPFLSRERVMVPLGPVLDAAGYRYRFDAGDRQVTIFGNRGDTRITVGDDYALVDGERVALHTPAQRIDDVLYVPAQILEEATDIRSDWDADRRILRLTTRYRAL